MKMDSLEVHVEGLRGEAETTFRVDDLNRGAFTQVHVTLAVASTWLCDVGSIGLSVHFW